MNTIILLATLKKEGRSNTETLCEFLKSRIEKQGGTAEIVKLAAHDILPGTCTDMGSDDWPGILAKITAADAIVFATPVWWGGHSSLMQRVIERLDELHDEILAGMTSRLYRKAFGIVVTGDSDGAEHITGNLANFANALGMHFPPYATLTVLSEKLAKDKEPTREELFALYEKDYAKTADTMVSELSRTADSSR
jgi:multimeric flavodoxin WrbA